MGHITWNMKMDYSLIKQPGLCSLCEKEVYEIIQRYANDHPLAGKIMKVGKSLDNAYTVQLVLTNGHRMSITLCDECHDLKPEDFVKIWEKIKSTWAFQASNSFRVMAGIHPMGNDEKEKYMKWFKGITKEIPIGILSEISHG